MCNSVASVGALGSRATQLENAVVRPLSRRLDVLPTEEREFRCKTVWYVIWACVRVRTLHPLCRLWKGGAMKTSCHSSANIVAIHSLT